MGMYEARAALADSHDLNQGDILADVLRPKPFNQVSFCVRQGPKVKHPATADDVRGPDRNLRLMCEVESISAIVISNSCDNTGSSSLLLVPIRKWAVPSDEPDHRRWERISQAATGTANPKLFYLPDEPEFGLSRSEAQLHAVFALTHEYLKRCIDEASTRRVCGLTSAAVRHLQWQIGVVFARDPREDYEWPSKEDLRLKLAYLDHHINAGNARRDDYIEQREIVRQLLDDSEKRTPASQLANGDE
ncbi:MAG TPA: hypothetical protein VFQ53_38340 [Kofleriaceae bacterium]|nr:hypothetical protein [Kofleriaceae bacterium]